MHTTIIILRRHRILSPGRDIVILLELINNDSWTMIFCHVKLTEFSEN